VGPEDLEGELAFDTAIDGVGNWRLYHYNRSVVGYPVVRQDIAPKHAQRRPAFFDYRMAPP
jgi:hypothetical protein